jgi:hypothetical protein
MIQEGSMPAGIVTQDDSVFTELMQGSPAPIRDVAFACRSLIYDVLPQTVEMVWPQQRTAGYGTGPKKASEQFCWVTPYTGHVTLGFYYGAELPDPEGILEGTGRLMRHVKIRSPKDLDNSALRTLIQAATAHRVPPPQTRI